MNLVCQQLLIVGYSLEMLVIPLFYNSVSTDDMHPRMKYGADIVVRPLSLLLYA